MASNPRKFSEKIALHLQKANEEQAAFDQIMREVNDVKQPPTPTSTVMSKPIAVSPSIPTAGTRPAGPYLTPNLSSSFRGGGSLPNVNQMAQHNDRGSHVRQMYNQLSSPRSNSRNSIGPVRVNTTNRRIEHSPYASPPNNPNNMSMIGQISLSNVGNNSPGLSYGINYLTPPKQEGFCRRANSDSALNSMIPSTVPDCGDNDSSNNSNDPRDFLQNRNSPSLDHSNNLNFIQLSPVALNDGTALLEIPTSISTGSLPDLTQLQFPPPLQQPLDNDDSQQNHSPYSTSPHTHTSYSPTSSISPNPPPLLNHIGTTVATNQTQTPQVQMNHGQNRSMNHCGQGQGQNHQGQQSVMDNPLQINTSFQNFSQNENILSAYRCPPQRPSPQNSPLPFPGSPLDGHLSAPSSPSPSSQQNTNQSPVDSFYGQQAQALQQHFEQSLSMMDSTEGNSPNPWLQGGISAPYFYGATAGTTQQQQAQHPQPQTPQTPSSIPDIIFTDFSETLRASEAAGLDDLFSTEGEDLKRNLNYSMTEEEFAKYDFVAAAAALREGLGPIDLHGLDGLMLADPDLVPLDPQAEEAFRLDRL